MFTQKKLKATIMQQFAFFELCLFVGNYFWYDLEIHFDDLLSCEGKINTRFVPTSQLGYALCSSMFQAGELCKNVRKAFTA